MLIHLERNDHLEDGNIDLEVVLVVEVFHGITSEHLAHFCPEITPADILIPLTRIQNRLNANYSLSFHLAVASVAVENMPVTAMKLDRKTIVVLDSDPIGKHILPRQRVRVVRLVKRFHAYFHPL
jgi:hypothetical protein